MQKKFLYLFLILFQDGKTYGDEYLAELDMIEIVEKRKEDYESDVTDIENSGEQMLYINSNSKCYMLQGLAGQIGTLFFSFDCRLQMMSKTDLFMFYSLHLNI